MQFNRKELKGRKEEFEMPILKCEFSKLRRPYCRCCHPEPREESRPRFFTTLRSVQNDKIRLIGGKQLAYETFGLLPLTTRP